MVDAISTNRNRLLPCVCVLDGEYGSRNVTAGVPAILGQDGVMKVIELPLDEAERTGFETSVGSILQDIEQL